VIFPSEDASWFTAVNRFTAMASGPLPADSMRGTPVPSTTDQGYPSPRFTAVNVTSSHPFQNVEGSPPQTCLHASPELFAARDVYRGKPSRTVHFLGYNHSDGRSKRATLRRDPGLPR